MQILVPFSQVIQVVLLINVVAPGCVEGCVNMRKEKLSTLKLNTAESEVISCIEIQVPHSPGIMCTCSNQAYMHMYTCIYIYIYIYNMYVIQLFSSA